MSRQDTRYQSQGAEFLVLGHLLVEGLQAHKMYTNEPGHDVLAVNAKDGKVAKISVKSRWKAAADGFIIRNFDSDFVVVVKLNKGTTEIIPPQFFVIPTQVLVPLRRPGWGKVNFRTIPNFDSYRGSWQRVRVFLGLQPRVEPTEEEVDGC